METTTTKKLRVGVIGVGRGNSMISYCKKAKNATLVAICDFWEEGLENSKKKHGDGIAYYKSYDEFINHDMDVVVLANYATEHAPFAIKAMNKGLHVISEVLPVQTLKEAVELVECIERTGKSYCYLENYCYKPGPREMKRLYSEGAIGEFQYGEGEYIHNCESIWPSITHGNPDHWRNNKHALYYCTHSTGPLLFITGLRPVKVCGFEIPFEARNARTGNKAGLAGIEMITLENGATIKSIHGGLYKDSVWYSVYGSKGRLETAREDASCGGNSRIYLNYDKTEADYGNKANTVAMNYVPVDEHSTIAASFGHGGSDYYSMWNAIESILGNPQADAIDVYGALDMALPGVIGYFSVLQGGVTLEIPDFRDKAVREKYRNDTRCTTPSVAGDQLIPTNAKGTPEIPQEVYDRVKAKWEASK